MTASQAAGEGGSPPASGAADDGGDDGNGQGREKRRRITQSCNMCRKKRIKCDGKEPQCGPCVQRNVQCVWAESKKRGPVPGRNVQARMQRLELHLADLFHLIPGLEDVSMMVLGISPWKPSQVLLAPHIPENYEEVKRMQAKANRHVAFKDSPVGRMFADDQTEGQEGSNSDATPFSHALTTSTGIVPSTNVQGIVAGHANNNQNYSTDYNRNNTSEPMSVADIINMLSSGQQSALDLYSSPSHSDPTAASTSTPATFGAMAQHYTPSSALPPTPRSTISQIQPVSGKNDEFVWEEDRQNMTCRVYGRSSSFKRIPSSSSRDLSNRPQIPDFPPQAQRTRLMDTYLTIIHPLLPMCSRTNLMQWSCSPNPSLDASLQPELLFAVMATASFYSSPVFPGANTVHLYQASEMAKNARWCLKSSLASPTLTTVQALILLALYDICMGEFTKAWADLGLVIGLAVDLGLPHSHKVLKADDPISIAHRTTWYSILVLETCLCGLLGKPPLLLDADCPPTPPETGPDEWELWRSESVQSLEFSYGGGTADTNDLNTSPVQSFGIITPARTLSTFAQSVTLMKLGRQALASLNAPESSETNVRNLKKCLERLEAFKVHLSDIEISETSLSSVPQHRLDLYCLWIYWRLNIMNTLALHDRSKTSEVDALAWQAAGLLAIKGRLYTHYRTAVLSLPFYLTLVCLSTSMDQVRNASHASLRQIQRIFPQLVDKLWKCVGNTPIPAPPAQKAAPSTSNSYYDSQLTSPPFSIPSVPPINPVNDWSSAFSFSDPVGQQPGNYQLSNFLSAQTPHTSHGGPSSGNMIMPPQDHAYSLPFAAMQNLSEQVGLQQPSQPFETSKIFDSASWAQTDVLSSLGFTDTPRGSPDHIGSEFLGLTGLLDRWNYSDGFTQNPQS